MSATCKLTLSCKHTKQVTGNPPEVGRKEACFKCGDTDSPRMRAIKTVKVLDADTQPAGPSPADVQAAVDQLQREMESPEFAAALDATDAIIDAAQPAECPECPDPEGEQRNPDCEGVQASTDTVERAALAQVEWKALKAWRAADVLDRPARPCTPNLDALNADHAAAEQGAHAPASRKRRTSKAAAKAAAKPAAPLAAGVRFFRDDRPMPDRHNVLSSVAYQCTKGINGKPRLSTVELRTLLADAGVEDPSAAEWKVTLPNGVVLETRTIA